MINGPKTLEIFESSSFPCTLVNPLSFISHEETLLWVENHGGSVPALAIFGQMRWDSANVPLGTTILILLVKVVHQVPVLYIQ